MRKTFLLSLCLGVVSCFGCAPVVGEKVDYSKACEHSNDGKMIEIEGFLDPSGGMTCSNIGKRYDCSFKLKNDLKSEERGFSADVAVGSGANSMNEVERGFKTEDLVVRDNEGNRIDLIKKVRVTGEQSVSNDPVSKDLVCFMNVYKIEQ